MTTTAEPTFLETLDDTGRALLFTEARSANSFADIPVTDAELDGIWNLARWSPSMANSQPLRVLFVRTGEGRERLGTHMAEGNRAKTLTAPAVAVLAYEARPGRSRTIAHCSAGRFVRAQVVRACSAGRTAWPLAVRA